MINDLGNNLRIPQHPPSRSTYLARRPILYSRALAHRLQRCTGRSKGIFAVFWRRKKLYWTAVCFPTLLFTVDPISRKYERLTERKIRTPGSPLDSGDGD